MIVLWLVGCASMEVLPKDQPCIEAGYAISRRTFDCTADADLANARYLQFQDEYECVPIPGWHRVQDGISVGGVLVYDDTGRPRIEAQDYFHCSFAISQLPCEAVEAFGDDLSLWLSASDACGWIVAPKEQP